MSNVRVRFAPSPTGPLHIGGVRTALYNYLFAKKHGGTFLLRIEDTDQNRYVDGAEQYIIDSLNWLGLIPEEGPGMGGNFGPYRQSERKLMYAKYADELIEKGLAYYAFDTAEELDAKRAESENDSFKYGPLTRLSLRNSLSVSSDETAKHIASREYTIRLFIPADQKIEIQDEIRGMVTFDSNELDDKVILKGDGMPTYHLANIVDDHLMEITHVIRGEEWLSSTAHHVLLYQYFGWLAPKFAHLPLILKPTGQGKLSKRDGAKFGFPVFPLDWQDEEGKFPGFREAGFLPEPLLNFLALLGWSPGNDIEVMALTEMIHLFDLDKIVKSGARFDFEKAQWFNQQYIINMPATQIAQIISEQAENLGYTTDLDKLTYCALMMKERVATLPQILVDAAFLFEKPKSFDKDTWTKKFKPENKEHFIQIAHVIENTGAEAKEHLDFIIKDYINSNGLKMGEVMPILRLSITGTLQGPDLFDTMSFLGKKESATRIIDALNNN